MKLREGMVCHWFNIVLRSSCCCNALTSVVLYCAALYAPAVCCAVLCCILLSCLVLHCTTLHWAVPPHKVFVPPLLLFPSVPALWMEKQSLNIFGHFWMSLDISRSL